MVQKTKKLRLRPEDILAHQAVRLENMSASLADTIRMNPNATIAPPLARQHLAEERAHEVMNTLRRGETRLRLAEPLGEGGMGVVRVASQVALDRMVAVKSLHPQHRTPGARLALLREAWITGSLEHPNVVPVHDIGVDDDGYPMIVLKRIEGVAWIEYMHDHASICERFATDDPLAWNLDILLSVCNAVRFAHSRGILHRDLKPENVMIGEFGEVYVLDWGLAVSLHGDERGVLPLASDVQEMAGTPCYMAPEMLGAGSEPLSERTDVYLLGGLLYEILAGHPPHVGDTTLELLKSVVISEPKLPASAPTQLAELCSAAMQAEPDDRIESADAMHAAIQEFLRYRGSARLADKAECDLQELLGLLDEPPADDDEPGQASHRQNLYRLFGACRFGFREALETWPDNEGARVGIHTAIGSMTEYELAAGHPRAADALLAELADPPAELRARVDAAVRSADRQERRMTELEKLSADLDTQTAAGARDVFVMVNAVLLTIIPVLIQVFLGLEAVTYPIVMGITAGFSVVLGSAYFLTRESIRKTAMNRQVLLGMVLLLVGQTGSEIGFWLLGHEVRDTIVYLLLLWAFTTASVAASGVSEVWGMVVCFLCAFFIAAWRVEWVLYCMSGANAGTLFIAVYIRWKRNREAARSPDENAPGDDKITAPNA